MSDDAAPKEEPPITFHVKSSGDNKYTLTLPLSTTISDLKTKLAGSEYSDASADRLRLIYSGRVMKDPDTLSTYNVKENHTIHLVKSAQSNQRQAPANQGASTTTTTGRGNTNQGIPGVPTNFAAGTGNNPLAGLTGARYAGFAQLPGMGMFGPDGGVRLRSLSLLLVTNCSFRWGLLQTLTR
jgi:ubiquilin